MLKWKLMLSTVPFAIGIVALAYLRAQWIPGLVEFADAAPLVTSAALIIGFMLSGVLSDYKESERLPGEISATLQLMEDRITANASNVTENELKDVRKKHFAVVNGISEWFINATEMEKCLQLIKVLSVNPIDSHLIDDANVLRRLLIRVDVIRRTSFIQSGYAILDLLVGSTLVTLIFANFKNLFQQILIVGFLALIYIYMIRFIRDIDDPFEYDASGAAGAAEVDLFPLTDYRARLEAAQNKSLLSRIRSKMRTLRVSSDSN
ncbi:MAG: hypothetical protein HY257_03385 [Chloroflexi bacterium]|nr:hypothetical protein [Chloroflexota bacterium]